MPFWEAGNTHTFCKQEKEKQKNKKSLHTSHRQSHGSGSSVHSDHWHMWLQKKDSLSLSVNVLILPHFTLYSTCGSSGEKTYGKFMLCSSDSAIQIRNCTSAYWSKRDFMWLSETWVSLLSKAWIKARHVPHCGNQNMNSTILPVMGPKTHVKIVYNFVQGQIWQDLWIIPEESLLKIRQIYKMS